LVLGISGPFHELTRLYTEGLGEFANGGRVGTVAVLDAVYGVFGYTALVSELSQGEYVLLPQLPDPASIYVHIGCIHTPLLLSKSCSLLSEILPLRLDKVKTR
jgi:hypothetical protein